MQANIAPGLVAEEVDEAAYVEKLFSQAEGFYHQYYREKSLGSPFQRLIAIQQEIERTGTYNQTFEELEFGAKVAWRNSNRCVGRIYWKALTVRDMRHLEIEHDIFDALVDHLNFATNGGKIRSAITVFKAPNPFDKSAINLWNSQLIRYAGYRKGEEIIGDPAEVEFTQVCQQLGWQGAGTHFDVLPLVIQVNGCAPRVFKLPQQEILEVAIEHPSLDWFGELQLKWHAVPIISNIALELGGIRYTAAPFNGWYMVNEIATRNFGDTYRYNLLPKVAERMGLDTSKNTTLWKDKALVELNLAVLDSFQKNNVSLVDHHTAAEQFMHFAATEEKQGRLVTADWAWIVPPMSGSTTEIYHREWNNEIKSPNYFYNTPSWKGEDAERMAAAAGCSFYAGQLNTRQEEERPAIDTDPAESPEDVS